MKPIQDITDANETLWTLRHRLQQSVTRLEAAKTAVPAMMHTHMAPGGYYPETGKWVIMVNHHALASKLRLFVPAIQEELVRQRLATTEIQIKVRHTH